MRRSLVYDFPPVHLNSRIKRELCVQAFNLPLSAHTALTLHSPMRVLCCSLNFSPERSSSCKLPLSSDWKLKQIECGEQKPTKVLEQNHCQLHNSTIVRLGLVMVTPIQRIRSHRISKQSDTVVSSHASLNESKNPTSQFPRVTSNNLQEQIEERRRFQDTNAINK